VDQNRTAYYAVTEIRPCRSTVYQVKSEVSVYSNKRFLVYVKKRVGEYSPFFVMWVDNAELMNEF